MENYAVLLIVDPEMPFEEFEVHAVHRALENGTAVAVFADWSSEQMRDKHHLHKENSEIWRPESHGCAVNSLNRILLRYGVALRADEGSEPGERRGYSYSGEVRL